MEESLKQLGANALLVSHANENATVLTSMSPKSSQDMTIEAADFARLNKLGHNLKIGSINQSIVVSDDEVRLSTKHGENTGVVLASNVGQALVADSLISQLLA